MIHQWLIKQLSTITNVSVKTLHHYDRIGLLKPSVRLANGYRVYSERDLLKLQQIIALKFLGFDLTQIKQLLQNEINMVEQFTVQAQLLREKASGLIAASDALNEIVLGCKSDKSIVWEKIIKSIEVYRMTQELEQTWAGQVLNEKELKDYAAFRQHLAQHSQEERIAFQQAWEALIAKVTANLTADPASEVGMQLAKECMDRVNKLYGKERAALRRKIWEEGFRKGYANDEHGITLEIVEWLDKAIEVYYRKRVMDLLAQIGLLPQKELLSQWNVLMEDMFGYEQEPRIALYHAILAEETATEQMKQWVRDTFDIHQ
ncbi:MAG: MerR family transcriptional regulator [Gammaproteobacteria bacterium]